tara:strand:+ start:43 stop:876 length:834 start_codon:yes stop_codon:yes gene_type:complete
MASYAYGKKAIGYCDRCGFQYPLHELKQEVVNLNVTNMLVCPECWDPDQPQTQLGRYHVSDPQALQNPRPPLGLTASRSTDGINLSYDFVTASTSSKVHGPHTYYAVNDFVYRLSGIPNTDSSMSWDSDGFYVTLSMNPTSSGNVYQLLTRSSIYGGPAVSIDTSKYKEVQVRMRKSVNAPSLDKAWQGSPGYGGTFWFDTGDGNLSAAPASDTPEPDWNNGVGGWNILTYNLSNNTRWTGASEVVGFEFRFYGYTSPGIGTVLDSYDLSWIKFIPY